MNQLSKQEVENEIQKIRKVFQCYSYLKANAGENQVLFKKIEALCSEHILSMIDELQYSVDLPAQERIRQLQEELKKVEG